MIVNKKGIIQIDLIIEKIMVVQHIIGFILTLILKVHVCFCVILIVNLIRKKYFQEKGLLFSAKLKTLIIFDCL